MKHIVVEIPRAGRLRGSDTLSVCGYRGRPVVFKTEEFPPGSLVVHIPHGSVVDKTRAEFDWLRHRRVAIERFFSKPSWGFFVAAPVGSKVGDEVDLGVLSDTEYRLTIKDPEPPRKFSFLERLYLALAPLFA